MEVNKAADSKNTQASIHDAFVPRRSHGAFAPRRIHDAFVPRRSHSHSRSAKGGCRRRRWATGHAIVALSVLGILGISGAKPAIAGEKHRENALGFKAFKRKEYRKAHAFFEQSTKKAPTFAFGWLNLARTTYLLNEKSTVADPCNLARNWAFRVLAYLSRAVELDPTSVLDKLDNDTPEFAFKKRVLYEKWRWAASLASDAPVHKDVLLKMLTNRELWPTRNMFPPTWFSLEANGRFAKASPDGATSSLGRWRPTEGGLEIQLEHQALQLRPKRSKFYFDEGRSWFDLVELVTEPTDAKVPWMSGLVLGPRYGDCGEANF
ncbi:MAG: hypothetical protein H6729_12285 [Deltaproteobacteria bacterium]|nr:hypothetical protein [Deltaproteobacteria bacterium]